MIIKQIIPRLIPILMVLLLGFLCFYALDILLPFFLAAVIAYILQALYRKVMHNIDASRLVTVVIILVLYGILTIIFALLIPLIYSEILVIYQLISQLDVDQIQHSFMLHIINYLPANLHDAIQSIMTEIPNYILTISKAIFSQLVNTTRVAAAVAMNIILAPIIAYYLITDEAELRKTAKNILTPKYYDFLIIWFGKIGEIMVIFCKAQFLACIIWFCYYGLLFHIIGLKYAVQLGIVAAIMSLIPYLGAIITLLLSIVLTMLQFGMFDTHLLMVLLVYVAGHVIEMVWVSNYIVGKKLGLHPLLTLFSLLFSAKFFGVMGMFFAMPAAVLVKLIIVELANNSITKS